MSEYHRQQGQKDAQRGRRAAFQRRSRGIVPNSNDPFDDWGKTEREDYVEGYESEEG